MYLRIGFEFLYSFPQPTPLIALLRVHPSRVPDLLAPEHLRTSPSVPLETHLDDFGNRRDRLEAPAGPFRLVANALVRDDGQPDSTRLAARQLPVPELPQETLTFLAGSRYCETDRLAEFAWAQFGRARDGWGKVQQVCDYVHRHLRFGYEHARSTRTAWEAFQEKRGVCRDYAHLAIALCRCLNLPARYCTGQLTDIGLPLPHAPGDFAAWMEVYLEGGWHVFDPRNNEPRIGRVLMARGRDAADVAMITSFGPSNLEAFHVWAVQDPNVVGES